MDLTLKKSSTLSKDDKITNRMKRKPMFDQTGNVLLNGVQLTFQRGFGFTQQPSITSPAHCIDDNKIVYLLGKQIIQYDMLTENQKVIDQIDQEEEITCFLYFKNLMLDDNILYSVHAMNKIYPSVVGKNYSKNMTQRYVLAHLEKEERVVGLMLVCDNKYIVALSELQGIYKLSYIDVHTKEIVGNESLDIKFVQGMFVPQAQPNSIILYTQAQLYYVAFGTEIVPIPLGMPKFLQTEASQKIVQAISSVFTSSDVLVYLITNKGNLMFITISAAKSKIVTVESIFLGEFDTVDEQEWGRMQNEEGSRKNQDIHVVKRQETSVLRRQDISAVRRQEIPVVRRNKIPSSICCNQYNLLIGYQLIQEFTLIKICPVMTGKPTLQKIPFSCPNLHKITRMQFAHQTMSVCVMVQVKENDRYDLSIPIHSEYLRDKRQDTVSKQSLTNHLQKPGKIFPVIFNMLLHDTLVETLRSPIQSILGWMLFVKEILDIAILPTKKIMLILSKERKIKAVRYEHLSSTSFQRMLIWQMHFNQNDCPAALDVHPLTYNVAIGFKEGLKMFTMSSQGLKPNNIQFPLKNCQSVRYSKFGHKLIAGSSNQIIIINPYENRIVYTIGLTSSYNVKELSFIDRDMYIFCQYTNGASQVMNCEGGRVFEVWKKDLKTICSAYDSVFDVLAVSYTDKYTKFYRERGSQEFGVLWTYPFDVTKILIVNQLGTIFMGTSMGKIRAYQWPFTDMLRFSKSFTEIQLHSAPVTRLTIIHDFSLLISGAQDGSIFISKINAYSDGIAISDAQIMHSLRSNNKNFTNLFYLQNYMITSSAIEFGHEETIVQLESDKADFESEYNDVISCIENENEERLRKEEKERDAFFRQQLQGREIQIQRLNQKKADLRQNVHQILAKKANTEQQLQAQKQSKMRQLYKQRDSLQQQKRTLQQNFQQKIGQQQSQCTNKLLKEKLQWKTKEDNLLKQIQVVEKEYNQAIVNYEELLKEENQEGLIYKTKMLEQLDQELQNQKEFGQKLRKTFNKIRHDHLQQQQKLKHFQQMNTQIQIDTQSNHQRLKQVQEHQKYLTQVLGQKDKIILQQQKHVKQLLSKNINNYTHEEYLKHKQDELLQKVNFLQQEIVELDTRYNTFQNDFVHVTAQTNQLRQTIQQATHNLDQFKGKDQKLKQQLYMKTFNFKTFINAVLDAFAQSKCDKPIFFDQLNRLMLDNPVVSSSTNTQATSSPTLSSAFDTFSNADSPQEKINKRDHLIKQVVNTNKLRKIDDNIRRTIMIKLNRETVSLTCEVNQLRKQKKKYTSKIKQLKQYISDLNDLDSNKQNPTNLKTKHAISQHVEDIIPANISIIRSKPSKHLTSVSSRQKLLPFQLYHSNKISKHSYHSKNYTKGDFDESSTQLPSFLPSILKGNSISEESSRLFNVAELMEGDEVNNNNVK